MTCVQSVLPGGSSTSCSFGDATAPIGDFEVFLSPTDAATVGPLQALGSGMHKFCVSTWANATGSVSVNLRYFSDVLASVPLLVTQTPDLTQSTLVCDSPLLDVDGGSGATNCTFSARNSAGDAITVSASDFTAFAQPFGSFAFVTPNAVGSEFVLAFTTPVSPTGDVCAEADTCCRWVRKRDP